MYACHHYEAALHQLAHPTGGGNSQSRVTFKRIAQLPSPVCPRISDRATFQEKHKMLRQQEEQQRNSLERALKLHRKASLPVPAHASGKAHVLPDLQICCVFGTVQLCVMPGEHTVPVNTVVTELPANQQGKRGLQSITYIHERVQLKQLVLAPPPSWQQCPKPQRRLYMQQVMRAAGTPEAASEMMDDDPADSASGTLWPTLC